MAQKVTTAQWRRTIDEHQARFAQIAAELEAGGDAANYTICFRDWKPTPNPTLERQKLAGEEDQSVPGWDQGA